MKQILCAAFLAAGVAGPGLAASPVAEIVCEPTEKLSQKLSRQYEVARTGRGIQGPDQIMEIWTGDQGDWTLVVTYATGTSCIVAMGENWQALQPGNPA